MASRIDTSCGRRVTRKSSTSSRSTPMMVTAHSVGVPTDDRSLAADRYDTSLMWGLLEHRHVRGLLHPPPDGQPPEARRARRTDRNGSWEVLPSPRQG